MISIPKNESNPKIISHKILLIGDKDLGRSLITNGFDIHLEKHYLNHLGIDLGVTMIQNMDRVDKFMIYHLSSEPKFGYLFQNLLPGTIAVIFVINNLKLENKEMMKANLAKILLNKDDILSRIIVLKLGNPEFNVEHVEFHDLMKSIQTEFDIIPELIENENPNRNTLHEIFSNLV